jgi:hypothetical protein
MVIAATVLHDLCGVKPAGAKHVKGRGFAGMRGADFAFGGHHVAAKHFPARNRSRRARQQDQSSD